MLYTLFLSNPYKYRIYSPVYKIIRDFRIEYNGKPAIEAWEYLHGEGGIPHSVGIAKFIITWNQDGSSHIADWRIDPWE